MLVNCLDMLKRDARAVIPSIDGGWRTSCPIATVAAGIVVTSLAFVAWRKYKHHKRTEKELREELEKLRTGKKSAVAEYRGLQKEMTSKRIREEELQDENEDLQHQLRDAVNTTECMESRLKEKDCENVDLINQMKEKDRQIQELLDQLEDKDYHIQDLLDEKEEINKEHEILEEDLREAANTIEDMKSRLQEKACEKSKLLSLHCKLIEAKDCQIQDLMAENQGMKEEQQHLRKELRDAANDIKDLERRLQEREALNAELICLHGNLIEGKDQQIQDLLAEKQEMKEEQEYLEEELRDAAKTHWYLERRLKEQELANEELKYVCDKVLDAHDRKIQDLLAKEEKAKEKLREALNNLDCAEKLLEEKEDEIHWFTTLEGTLAVALCNIEEDLEKALKEKGDLQMQIENRDCQIQDMFEKGEKLKNDHEVLEDKLKEALSNMEDIQRKNLQKLQELAKECALLKEKCRKLEESKEMAENCAREQRRLQEEALRLQDKYMLMGVLHRIAQRDFELERIVKEEHESTETGGEKQEIGSQDQGQETNQEFCCAQNEHRGYLKKQWLDVTDILEDILYRDERSPEEIEENSSKNHD
ncbi:interaptin-like [Macrobrachium rosenbergii]|uniref:interaptin-like n=1 Tax=Macrobrachium rosenbergii TaxID=79674 RepID=UPI0034D3D476